MKNIFPRNIPYSLFLIVLFTAVRTIIWKYSNSLHMALLVIIALIITLLLILGYRINAKGELVGGRKKLSVHRIRKVIQHRWYVSVYYATNVRGRLGVTNYYPHHKAKFIKALKEVNPNIEEV